MEDRATSLFQFGKQILRFLCVFLLLSVDLSAGKPWLTKPAHDWGEEDVTRLLSDSPWVQNEAIRVVPSVERTYLQSFFGVFGREHLYWVRFTWLAEPIRNACELVANLSIVLRRDSGVSRFLTAFRALEHWQHSSGQDLLNEKNILVLLEGDILSGLIGPHNSQTVETAFLSTEKGGRIESCGLLYGLRHASYRIGKEGVERALVEVEDLKAADLAKEPEADESPEATIKYAHRTDKAHDVLCVVLMFPRDELGDEDVKLVVPFGGKVGLKAEFRLSEMFVVGEQKF